MNKKCHVCQGRRTVARDFNQILCLECKASGWDLNPHRPIVAPEQSTYAITSALPKLLNSKRGRPKKDA